MRRDFRAVRGVKNEKETNLPGKMQLFRARSYFPGKNAGDPPEPGKGAWTLVAEPKVGLYLRLSRDDGDTDESMSITNQRDFLQKYVAGRGWQVTNIYIDDTAILGLKSELQ